MSTDLTFYLDPRLSSSCFTLTDWPLSRVLLKNNAEYPWLILVPRRANLTELIELSSADQSQLMHEINRAGEIIQNLFQPDKINMGALGNIVRQFHYHLIARFKQDSLWPEGVWQKAAVERPYKDPEPLIEKLRRELACD